MKTFRSVDVAPRGSVTSTSFMLTFMLSSAVSTFPLKRYPALVSTVTMRPSPSCTNNGDADNPVAAQRHLGLRCRYAELYGLCWRDEDGKNEKITRSNEKEGSGADCVLKLAPIRRPNSCLLSTRELTRERFRFQVVLRRSYETLMATVEPNDTVLLVLNDGHAS